MKKESVFKKVFGNTKQGKKTDCECNVVYEEVKKETKSKPIKDSCCNINIEELED